ncbi:MAG: YARHG domain-containing protein [Marvinbryantia sp.]|jgi:hypothetical protein
MRKTKEILTLLASAAVLTAAAPVLAQEGGTEMENLFYTYSKDNMIAESYDADMILAAGELQQKSYDAFLAIQETDLNWDGVNELLAIRLKPQQNGEGQTVNTVIAEVYQKQENALQRIAQYTLAEGILDQTAADIDVFLVQTQSGQLVCCEAKDTASVLADGIEWSLRSASFDGTQFYAVQNEHFIGSAPEPDVLESARIAMNNLGLDVPDVLWNSAVDQLDYLEPICTIDRYFIVDQPAVQDFVNTGGNGEEIMQYGETVFRNCWNIDWENKMQKEFARIIEKQTAAETGNLSYAGDFVIADSSSRYITEEELAALSETELMIARNEIYARHGRMFNNQDLNAYFNTKPWYQPTVSGEEFTEEYASGVFNEIEITNISTIVNYEKTHGLNQF